MPISPLKLHPQVIGELAQELESASPVAVLKAALGKFAARRIALSFSGAEDVVLIDMLSKLKLDDSNKAINVFCLDTGRLHAETYKFIEKVRTTYDLQIHMLVPEVVAVERLVREKGLFSFYDEGHQECCDIRKVSSLKRHLANMDAWLTGQRRDQSKTRTELAVVEADSLFAAGEQALVKFNPLAGWMLTDVWDYIHDQGVPYNPLHDQGYISIGCEPCTRAVRPGEHERAGRWWWEAKTQRECGLHVRKP